MIAKAKINAQGRVVIPAPCREQAGLKPGDDVLIEVLGPGELRLRTKAEAVRKAQTIVARRVPKRRDLARELIKERRREAARQ